MSTNVPYYVSCEECRSKWGFSSERNRAAFMDNHSECYPDHIVVVTEEMEA